MMEYGHKPADVCWVLSGNRRIPIRIHPGLRLLATYTCIKQTLKSLSGSHQRREAANPAASVSVSASAPLHWPVVHGRDDGDFRFVLPPPAPSVDRVPGHGSPPRHVAPTQVAHASTMPMPMPMPTQPPPFFLQLLSSGLALLGCPRLGCFHGIGTQQCHPSAPSHRPQLHRRHRRRRRHRRPAQRECSSSSSSS